MHLGISLLLYSTILLLCHCLCLPIMRPHAPCTLDERPHTLFSTSFFHIFSLFLCKIQPSFINPPPTPHTHTQPPSQFPSALYLFSLLVTMLQCFMWALQRYTCGVAALVLGVTSKTQRGASPIASANWAYWLVCWPGRMYSWRVGGQ